jgi:glycosyltransferase involved in cell wall biosynthesis
MEQSPEPRCVGFVSPAWPAKAMANGIVSYVSTICRGLTDLGINTQVLTPKLMEPVSEPGVHLIPFDAKTLYAKIMRQVSPENWLNPLICKGLRKEIARLQRENGLQLLELEESFGWPRYLAGHSLIPLIVRLHGPWFLNGIANGATQDASFRRRDNWEKAGLRVANGVTAPSRHVLDQTREHFGLPLPGARVIFNPVERVAPENRWTLQNCDRHRIAFIGRFDRHKGGDTMIDAFAHVLSGFPDARLDFVGPDRGCLDSSGRSWSFEEYLAAKLGEADRAKVSYHGFQPNSTAAELRKRALVTVAPSRYEAFGIAAAEAMMAGCPLVVCGAGALSELVQHERNGLIAGVGDGTDVGEKLLSLLRNPERAANLGEQAAADAASRYAPEVIARETIDFYRDVLKTTK